MHDRYATCPQFLANVLVPQFDKFSPLSPVWLSNLLDRGLVVCFDSCIRGNPYFRLGIHFLLCVRPLIRSSHGNVLRLRYGEGKQRLLSGIPSDGDGVLPELYVMIIPEVDFLSVESDSKLESKKALHE